MKTAIVQKHAPRGLSLQVRYCDTYFSRLLGLMFTQHIDLDGGLIIVENKESIARTSIHMMFMKFDIAAIWLSGKMVVVDKLLAKRWVPFYAPGQPAQYVLELHPSKLSEFSIGDQLEITLN